MKQITILYLILIGGLLAEAQNINGTVRGKLYYKLKNEKTKIGADLKIYMIPKITQNANIVNNASKYSAACNEQMLESAKNYKVAITDKGGFYYFSNIAPGSYFLKICTYYGGYYFFTIKSNFRGTINLPDFEVDPPI